MKIIAIWNRPQADEIWGGVFLLCDNKQLLYCQQQREYDGKNANGKNRYIETASPDYSFAFKEEDRFDFHKANFFLRHFGGKLIWKEKSQ